MSDGVNTPTSRTSWRARLRRLVCGPADAAAEPPVLARLDAIDRRLADLAVPAAPLPAPEPGPVLSALAAMQEALTALEKQVGRAGREQFKTNTLAEEQAARLTAALELLQAADSRRAAELAALREQTRAEQAAARLELVQALLPTLDGLDEALRSGRQLLEQQPPAVPARSPTLLERLSGHAPAAPPADSSLREAMAAWLDGLALVQQRLLDTLAAEGVRPMPALAQPFDPHQHMALEVVPASDTLPPGMVAAELRRGYLAGDRVLRAAEVAVARD